MTSRESLLVLNSLWMNLMHPRKPNTPFSCSFHSHNYSLLPTNRRQQTIPSPLASLHTQTTPSLLHPFKQPSTLTPTRPKPLLALPLLPRPSLFPSSPVPAPEPTTSDHPDSSDSASWPSVLPAIVPALPSPGSPRRVPSSG